MRRSPIKYLLPGALLIVAIALSVVSQGRAADPKYISPDSSRTTVPLSPDTGLTRPLRVEPKLGSRLLYRTQSSLREEFTYDPGLSRACRNGNFLQRLQMRYVVVAKGVTYGAVLAMPQMLYDPRGVADPKKLYIFRGQGTTNCRVYHRLL